VRRVARFGIGWAVLALALSACVPWRDYPVSPLIEGRVSGAFLDGASLRLEVQNESSEALGAHREASIDADGSFRIDPISLRLGGREFFKLYAVYLRFQDRGGDSRIVWRSEWHRGWFGERLELECELQRTMDYGQPCLVVDAVQHRWLVSNGQLEFLESCSSCHNVGAVGDGPAAAGLHEEPPDLTRIAARRGRFDRDEIRGWIDGRRRAVAHGPTEMPIWGLRMPYEDDLGPDSEDLAAARIDAIVTYLESIQRPAEGVVDEGRGAE